MSILNNIWNRIARKPDRRKAAATEFSETGNRVYAVATEEGVMLFSDTPKGMKARNSYLQHLADGFFNVAKVPETLRIYEMDLPTKRVAELADNCIEKLSKADLRSTDAQLRRSVVSFARFSLWCVLYNFQHTIFKRFINAIRNPYITNSKLIFS